MKKTLILILIALLLLLSIFVIIQGLNIGSLEILGVKGIQNKNNQLDEKIQEATKLAEKDYVQVLKDIENNSKELKQEKKNYEDMITITTEDGEQVATQIEKYEIETLWVRLGNHATSQGVVMKMDVKKGANSVQDVYDLYFTATGDYISITDFISSIENDSTLGFKIEGFSMKPTSDALQATFVCKDISIRDVDTSVLTQNNIEGSENTEGAESTTNTNSTNTANNTTNSTNTSNTTNTANAATNTQ